MTLPVTFTLNSPLTQPDAPFAFGHVFAKGDVRAGYFVNSDLTDWQATPTTYWSDGSVRHAIIAGRANTTGAPVAIQLSESAAGRSGTALTEADLTAALPVTTLVCGTETITLNNLIGTSARHSPLPGQDYVCSGPVMSQWIYRKQLAGSNHLVAWFEVRLFKGGAVEIHPWIENGFLMVAAPTNDVRTYVLTIGGVERFNASLDVKHHTRPSLINGSKFYWTGTDPQITPKHGGAYWMASCMVPNYGWLNPSATKLNSLIQTYTPNTLAGISSGMGVAGSSAALIQTSQSLYITSNADARAWNAAIVFGLSGGSWSTHYRDESTNEPISFLDRANVSFQDGTTPPSGTGGTNGSAVTTHQPSFGYLPWLLTGRWWFLEEQLYWTTYNYLCATTGQRRGDVYGQNTALFPSYSASAAAGICDGRSGTYTVRGAAWSIRGIAQSLAILPTSHPCFASVKNSWEKNVGYYHDSYVAGTYESSSGSGTYWVSPFGPMSEYGNPYGNANYWGLSGWMHGMMQQVWGFAKDLNLPQTTSSQLIEVVNHNLKLSVGLAGGVPGWNYRRFVAYSLVLGDADATPSPWYTDWAAALTNHEAFHGNAPVSSAPGLSLFQHSSNNDLGSDSSWPYFGQQFASLAYAVTHELSGAQAGWNNITGASNYATVTAQFNDDPSYGIVPRLAAAEEPVGTTPGQSVRIDNAPPFANSVAIGARGLGISGSSIASTGEHGAAPLYASLDPGDDNNEYQMLITSVPAGLHLTVSDIDGSIAVWADEDGVYPVPFDIVENGASIGSAQMLFEFGETNLAGSNSTQTALSGTGAISVSVIPAANLAGAGSSQTATSGTGAVGVANPVNLTGSSSGQGAESGVGAITLPVVINLAGSNSEQGNSSSTGAVTATVVLTASDANTYRGVPRVRTIGGSTVHFSAMHHSESEIIAFDFVDTVAPGVTVASVVELKNAVVIGVDPDANSTIKGSSISGTTVSVMVGDLKPGVTYQPRCVALMSNGEKKELPDQGQGYLRVIA